jgi:hypothetical protein
MKCLSTKAFSGGPGLRIFARRGRVTRCTGYFTRSADVPRSRGSGQLSQPEGSSSSREPWHPED